MRTLSAIALASIFLAGCKTVYTHTPAPGDGSATLRVATHVPFVYLTEHAGCPKSMLANSSAGAETSIPAGKRLWLEPGYSNLGIPGGRECEVPISFVADAGKNYVLMYENRGKSCAAAVMERDADGGLHETPSLKREKFERCMY